MSSVLVVFFPPQIKCISFPVRKFNKIVISVSGVVLLIIHQEGRQTRNRSLKCLREKKCILPNFSLRIFIFLNVFGVQNFVIIDHILYSHIRHFAKLKIQKRNLNANLMTSSLG